MGDIDPVQFGELVGSVKTLSAEVEKLNQKVDALVEVKNKGAGILIGIGLAGGSIGAVASHWMERLFK